MNYHFQPDEIVVHGKATAPFLSSLTKKLVDMSGDPGSNSVSTSTCLWLWTEETLPAYLPVCWLNQILVVPSVLTSIIAPHLPLRQFNS